MKNKKKLLFVINTMGRAGAEKALVEFLATLDKNIYDVSLYVMINRGDMYNYVPEGVKILNKHRDNGSVLTMGGRIALARISFCAIIKKFWVFRNFGYLINNISQQRKNGKIHIEKLLWQAVSDGARRFDCEYDLAVAYLEGASTYYVSNYVKAKKKVSFIHTDYVRAGYTPYIDRGCFDRIDRVFTVSSQAREHFCEVYPEMRERVYLFRNIINGNEIRRKAGLEGGLSDDYKGIRLLTVGRLCPEKGYDVAIEAAKIVKSAGVDFRWYVLGEGSQRKNLEKLIRRAGVEENFILLGAVDNPYVYMKNANIYVHETRFEGKSIAVEEAQTLCLPIIASDCDGNIEQITDGYDGIITPLDAKVIAETVIDLINDTDKQRMLSDNVSKKQIQNAGDMKYFEELLEG